MLSSKVQACLQDNGVELEGKNILCCVSGGADSMALLHYLHSNREMLGIAGLFACHYNHSMRGSESLRDEKVVIEYCNQNSVPIIVDRLEYHFDINHIDHSENTLRILRYQFFEIAAENCKADLVATAHNLNDDAETIIFRIARGTGLRGLSGIPVVRGKYIRPLLYVSRDEIEEYCILQNVPFIVDSSNLEDDYKRNVIRHKVLPVLKDISVNYLDAIRNLSNVSGEADYYFTEEARSVIYNSNIKNGITRNSIIESRRPLNAYIILLLFSKFQLNLSGETVRRCLELVQKKGKIEVSSDIYWIVDDEKCWIEKKVEYKEFGPLPFDQLDDFFENKKFEFIEDLHLDAEAVRKLFYSCVDYDKLNGVPQFRSRKDGDVFSSAYRNNTKSLKKLFNEKKYSAEERNSIILLTDASGIIWLEGEGPARGKEIDIFTKRVIRFSDISRKGEKDA